MNQKPAARGSPSAPLYVIPPDSLLTLAPGTPVQVVLRSGARVVGSSLRSRPDEPGEFLVRAPASRLFAPPDTVQIPITGIEVAVSTMPLASGSQSYVGPRRLQSLPPVGEDIATPMRPVVVALTIVAIVGALALAGVFVTQEGH